MTSEITSHIWLPEPKLSFHPDRSSDVDIHPELLELFFLLDTEFLLFVNDDEAKVFEFNVLVE